MSNPLMEFRLAYLQVLAKAWGDPKYEKKITNPPHPTKTHDLLPHLAEFRFHSPWTHIRFELLADEAQKPAWRPRHAAGWVGRNDRFILYLPTRPEQEDQRVEALAAYYDQFPTIFGKDLTSSDIDGPLPTNLGASEETFFEFGGVTLRAIALAWKDEQFRSRLTDPRFEDATPVLSQYLGYNSPWNFNIQFLESSIFKWAPKNGNGGEETEMEWKGIPDNIVQLYYPYPPEDKTFRPIALTSYNNTGPQYPFTCM